MKHNPTLNADRPNSCTVGFPTRFALRRPVSSTLGIMSNNLTWNDLFIQHPSLEFEKIFSCWPQFSFGRIRPIGLSAFGDCYFEHEDGSVHVLDPLEGNIRQVAASQAEFGLCMNSPEWQDKNLMPELVALLNSRGVTKGANQVFGFAPHPAFTGKINPEQAMPLDAVVWHSISGQVFAKSSVQP